MATIDLNNDKTKSYPAPNPLSGQEYYIARDILGSEIANTGASTDTYKIMKVAANQLITSIRVVVTDADNSANSMDLGYTDGTNTSATYFSAAIDVSSTGCKAVIADKQFLAALDTDITLIPNDTLESDTRFSIIMGVIDLNGKQGETLTAPITQ